MAFWQPKYSKLIKIPNATLQFCVYDQFVSLWHDNTDDKPCSHVIRCLCVCSDTCSVPGLCHSLLQHHDERHEETWLRHRTGRRHRQHTVCHVCLVQRGAAVQSVAKTPGSPKQEITRKTIFFYIFLRPLTKGKKERKKNQPGPKCAPFFLRH